MRKINAILTVCILICFSLHGILGALSLIGAGEETVRVLAYITLALITAHVVLGMIFTVRSIRVWRMTKAPYLRENRLFWARRISGLAIMILLFFHVGAFGYMNGGAYRLSYFGTFRLITQLLLVLAIALHVITNVKPMLISLGERKLQLRAGDILLVLSVLLFFFAAAFIIYFIRWNTL